jgi:ATP-dependent Lon protease
MVLTRATAKSKSSEPEIEITQKKKSKKPIQIQLIPSFSFKNVDKTKNDSNQNDDDSDIEEDDIKEEYYDYIDENILKNKKLKKKVDKIINHINDNTITLEQILNAKIRKKNKVELFELYLIYESISIISDEKVLFRNKIFKLFNLYQKQYEGFMEYKSEIDLLESSKSSNDLFDLQLDIVKLNTSFENKNVIYSKYLELLEKKNGQDDEYFKLKNWIQTALKLPYDNLKVVNIDLNYCNYLTQVKSILNKELYGMDKVKEQLLLFIHSKLINPNVKGCCLGLVGEPGVGKTSIARCLAKILNIPFSQITFGGVHNAEFIRGYDYTYVGSQPGEIVRCLSRMKYKNGIIFLDEYEKISNISEINSCLLHITDFSQNCEFRDNFLSELTIDLSSIWFIYSMNDLPKDQALKDRIFIINVDGYNIKDQVQILCYYLLPKHLTNLNLSENSIILSENIAEYLIQKYANHEKGVRTIEKNLKDLINKISFLVTNQNNIQVSFILPPKYFPIQYPVIIDQVIIDTLLNNKKSNSDYLNMYL